MSFSFIVADLTLNLLTIYLQFGFAQDHYYRCCGPCDRGFKGMVSKKMNSVRKKSVGTKQLALDNKMKLENVVSASVDETEHSAS